MMTDKTVVPAIKHEILMMVVQDLEDSCSPDLTPIHHIVSTDSCQSQGPEMGRIWCAIVIRGDVFFRRLSTIPVAGTAAGGPPED
jgi:hypothetical protein